MPLILSTLNMKTLPTINPYLDCLLLLQGICFAPSTSEQLSLCYANRSATLYHLQHYQVSLCHLHH